MNKSFRRIPLPKRILMILLLAFGLFIMMGPVLWTLISSFRTNGDLLQPPVKYIPDPFVLENYPYAWKNAKFSDYFLNSMIVSTAVAAIVVILATFCAYALSRYQFKGKKMVIVLLMATQFIPAIMLITPLFKVFNRFHLISSLTGIILLFTAFQLPYSAILMMGFVDGVPYSIEEAAMVDGCSKFHVLTRIVAPMLLPGFVAVASFAFIMSWNEYLFPVIFINDPKRFTISVGLGYMLGAYGRKFGALSAGCIISMSVPLILFTLIQKYLIAGLTAGSVKE